MKHTLILLTLLFVQSNAVLAKEEFPELKEIKKLLKVEKHEEAATYIAKVNKTDIVSGYRSVAWFLSRENHGGKNSQAIREYYTKGCEGKTDIACIEYGLMLEHYKQFKKAEKVYLSIESANQDIQSAERLYYLYHKKSWEGHNLAKSKEWGDIYFERAKVLSMERKNKIDKYNSNK